MYVRLHNGRHHSHACDRQKEWKPLIMKRRNVSRVHSVLKKPRFATASGNRLKRGLPLRIFCPEDKCMRVEWLRQGGQQEGWEAAQAAVLAVQVGAVMQVAGQFFQFPAKASCGRLSPVRQSSSLEISSLQC